MILYYISLTLITGCVIATVLQAVLRGFAENFKLYYLMRVISTLTIFLATFIGVLFVLYQNLFLFERSDAKMPVAVYYVSDLVYGIIRDRHVTDPKHIVFMVFFFWFSHMFSICWFLILKIHITKTKKSRNDFTMKQKNLPKNISQTKMVHSTPKRIVQFVEPIC